MKKKFDNSTKVCKRCKIDMRLKSKFIRDASTGNAMSRLWVWVCPNLGKYNGCYNFDHYTGEFNEEGIPVICENAVAKSEAILNDKIFTLKVRLREPYEECYFDQYGNDVNWIMDVECIDGLEDYANDCT